MSITRCQGCRHFVARGATHVCPPAFDVAEASDPTETIVVFADTPAEAAVDFVRGLRGVSNGDEIRVVVSRPIFPRPYVFVVAAELAYTARVAA